MTSSTARLLSGVWHIVGMLLSMALLVSLLSGIWYWQAFLVAMLLHVSFGFLWIEPRLNKIIVGQKQAETHG